MKPSTRKALRLLECGPVSTGDFMEARVGRASARIMELRRDHGCVISTRPVHAKRPRGPQVYTLVSGPVDGTRRCLNCDIELVQRSDESMESFNRRRLCSSDCAARSSTREIPPEGWNPAGLCQCGCGERTPIAQATDSRNRMVKGTPVRFVPGHQGRKSPTAYIVDPATGCWNWQRGKTTSGYGHVRADGRVQHAHRVAYERAVGPIPEGMHLDHLCRNRSCVNPAHLEPVTNGENQRRGRVARGLAEPTAEDRERFGEQLELGVAA